MNPYLEAILVGAVLGVMSFAVTALLLLDVADPNWLS